MVWYRGANFFPSAVEQIVRRQPGLSPEYRIVLEEGRAGLPRWWSELYEKPLMDPNIGPGKLLWGTDWGASMQIYSQLLILGGNAARVFKLELPHTRLFKPV